MQFAYSRRFPVAVVVSGYLRISRVMTGTVDGVLLASA